MTSAAEAAFFYLRISQFTNWPFRIDLYAVLNYDSWWCLFSEIKRELTEEILKCTCVGELQYLVAQF
jgi:hypothetical protein